MKNSRSRASGKGVFNTLALSRTSISDNCPVILIGKGSEIENKRSANGRTKRKLITNSMVLSLIDIAKEENNFEAAKQLWNTYHCQSSLVSANGRVYGSYCKNRICTVCNANRKAELINKYLPELQTWDDAQFVTITIKSCKAAKLQYYIEGMLKTFRKIKDRQYKRYQRGKGIQLVGIRSLECNFNPQKKTYNPHFHLIVHNREMADIIVQEWLSTIKTNKIKHVTPKAQHINAITNKEAALIEVIKYGSKIFTEPDLKKKKTGNEKVYAKALYNILMAMKGHRIFDRFGFNPPEKENETSANIALSSEYERWTFKSDRGNWINDSTKEALTSYVAPFELLELLAFKVDTETS